jgi:hypothetical protein
VEKEHIKRSPLKPLNSNVYYVHDVPIIKMLPQAAVDNDNNSSGAIDDQSLALATVQLEFTSDGSSKAERELEKCLKHESLPATNVCEAEDQDEGVCKSADREEALRSSSPVIKMAHDNLVIYPCFARTDSLVSCEECLQELSRGFQLMCITELSAKGSA